MRRSAAMAWHASLSVIAAILYFLFVIPRWWELTDFTPHVLGTVMRVVVAALIGLAALPVVFTLQRARQPEFGTPQLALTLMTGSAAAHVTAGALIGLTALSEIWLSLDAAGPWLFAIYGAAAAIAVLGIGAFYLSGVAELPPPPPKPIKPKREKRRKKNAAAVADEDVDTEDVDSGEDEDFSDDGESEIDDDESEIEAEEDEDVTEADEADEDTEAEATVEVEAEPAPAGARHKLRPSGKRRNR